MSIQKIHNRMIDGASINVKDCGVIGNGTIDDYNSLNTLITLIGSNKQTLTFPVGTYNIGTNITFPANVALYFTEGAMLSPDSGKTVTINGHIIAGIQQIFTGSGTIAGLTKTEKLYVEWWGAVGDGSTDDTTVVQIVVNMAQTLSRTEVYFANNKTYKITTLSNTEGLTFFGDNVTITGGATITVESLGSRISDIVGNQESTFINVKYPPAGLTAVTGDGVTDDYAAIIAILEYMDYKGVIYFPEGTYCISEPIHLGLTSADDAVNTFLVDGLTVLGEGSNLTEIKKTTSTLDSSSRDSIFYTNAVRTHFANFKTTGLGFDTTTIAFNLRRFSTMSSIKHCYTHSCNTGVYLDSVYIADIYQYHASTCKQVFDSSTSEKTSLTLDKVWGENVWRFGYFAYINYSHFGTLLCDWANIPAPENTYGTPVSIAFGTLPIYGVYDFYLCNTIAIDNLACEHANARTFLYYGSSSLNISQIHVNSFENSTGSTLNTNGKTPIVGINSGAGVKKCWIGNIYCNDFTDITHIVYYPYASATYGSKFEPYLTIDNMPYDKTAVGGNASTNNTDIMVKHPKSKYPIYWDKTTPDATAKAFYLKVATDGSISSQEITYYYYA